MSKIDNLLKPNYNEFKVLRQLKKEEIDKIENKYQISNFFIFKKKIKSILVKLINIFGLSNTVKITNPRSFESVQWKYENIAGNYIKNHKNKNKLKFIAINDEKKVFECLGMITPYYGECLKNLYNFYNCKSVLEVGAGELTTIYTFLKRLKKKPNLIGAIDMSYKRLLVGKKYLNEKKMNIKYLAKADASKLPFKNNSFDFVYTANCLEQVPNLFVKSLREAVRVSSNLIVIIEPSYQFGTNASRNNIIKKGYTQINDGHFKKLGLKPIYRNSLKLGYYHTLTEIVVLRKRLSKNKQVNKVNFICPKTHETLYKNGKLLSNKDNSISYKILKNIPLLCMGDRLN